MKKIAICALVSVLAVISSLSFVNYVLLSDTTVDSSVQKDYISEDAQIISYVPDGYTVADVSADGEMIIFLTNGNVRVLKVSTGESFILDVDDFASGGKIIDDNNILIAHRRNNSVYLLIYTLSTGEKTGVGTLDYRYFIDMANVRFDADRDNLYFDIVYRKNNADASRGYKYNGDSIIREDSAVLSKKKLTLSEGDIIETQNSGIYINGVPFVYDGVSRFSLLGVDSNEMVYLKDDISHNDTLITVLSISDKVEVKSRFSINNGNYLRTLCTDGLYFIGEDSILDARDSSIVNIDSGTHVLYIDKKSVLFEEDGIIKRQIR